jgi:hypothetical protein
VKALREHFVFPGPFHSSELNLIVPFLETTTSDLVLLLLGQKG